MHTGRSLEDTLEDVKETSVLQRGASTILTRLHSTGSAEWAGAKPGYEAPHSKVHSKSVDGDVAPAASSSSVLAGGGEARPDQGLLPPRPQL
jgi:hypothetical protein